MKRIILAIVLVTLFASITHADMRVVIKKSTGEIAYRQIPDFAPGLGIKNAVSWKGGKPSDYEEVTMTQEEWDTAHLPTDEDKIKAREAKILRQQAIAELKEEGKLNQEYE